MNENKNITYNITGTVLANLAWYRRTKNLVPPFDPKVHLYENSLPKIMVQLQWLSYFVRIREKQLIHLKIKCKPYYFYHGKTKLKWGSEMVDFTF